MKSTVSVFLSFSGFTSVEPAFVGLLTTPEVGALCVIVPSIGVVSWWARIGDTVEDYQMVEYRPKEKVLGVNKGGQGSGVNVGLRLGLVQPRFRSR
jgi:hypothetical protein